MTDTPRTKAGLATPEYWFAQGTLIHGPDRGGIDVGPLIGEARTDASAKSLVERHNSTLRALAATPAVKPEAGLDVKRCENCDHRKLDHYFGDALCYEHKAMHTPCIRVARHEAKRCLCHAYSGPEESKP